MSDQADHLRVLVQSAATVDEMSKPPYLVAVTGGRPHVGVTTTAVGVATALGRAGHNVALVDADLQRPSIAARCNVTGDATIADVLAGRRTVGESLVQGASGVKVLPGLVALGGVDVTLASVERLFAGLKRIGSTADIVVLDIGVGTNRGTRSAWQAADLVLLVTTNDPDTVMDAYAAVKLACATGDQAAIATVVSGVCNGAEIRGVHSRLASACRRFMKLDIYSAPPILRSRNAELWDGLACFIMEFAAPMKDDRHTSVA